MYIPYSLYKNDDEQARRYREYPVCNFFFLQSSAIVEYDGKENLFCRRISTYHLHYALAREIRSVTTQVSNNVVVCERYICNICSRVLLHIKVFRCLMLQVVVYFFSLAILVYRRVPFFFHSSAASFFFTTLLSSVF